MRPMRKIFIPFLLLLVLILHLTGSAAQMIESVRVDDFYLYNDDLDIDILLMTDGMTIDLADYPGIDLDMRADATIDTDRVDFYWSEESVDKSDYSAPFLLRDAHSAGSSGELALTLHTAIATPYSGSQMQGDEQMGEGKAITFTVVDSGGTSPPPPGATGSLLAYWDFDEGSGTVANDVIGGEDGQVVGASWTTGVSGEGLWFDGVNDYVSTSFDLFELDENSAFSVSLWFKTTRTTRGDLFGNYAGTGGDFRGWINDPTLRFRLKDGLSNAEEVKATASTLADDNWHHAVFARSGAGKINFFLDGQQVATEYIVDEALLSYTPGPWYLGHTNGGSYPFSGSLDEIKVFNYELSLSEVEEEFNSITPPTLPPEPYCGDSICDNTEDCETCSIDCGSCPAPPPPPGETGSIGDVSLIDDVDNSVITQILSGQSINEEDIPDPGDLTVDVEGEVSYLSVTWSKMGGAVFYDWAAPFTIGDAVSTASQVDLSVGTHTFTITPFGPSGAGTPYELTFQIICSIACTADTDCDDGDVSTVDTCVEYGTCDSSCSYAVCLPSCTSDAGCDDGVPETEDTCNRPGTCEASCVHDAVDFTNNGICDLPQGETCLNAPKDCACASGSVCDLWRTADVRGCYETSCGDGYLDKDEDCCLDAGCPDGLLCNEKTQECVACRTNADCGDGFCIDDECASCRFDADCESGLCVDHQCVECLRDVHCSSRNLWAPQYSCSADSRRIVQGGERVEGVCDKSTQTCQGERSEIRRVVRDCQDTFCYEGQCGCPAGYSSCAAARRCVRDRVLAAGDDCSCDSQCAEGLCMRGTCRIPRIDLRSDSLNLTKGRENRLFFELVNPFDEEVDVTLVLSVGPGIDVSSVLACDEAIGSTCKITRRLGPGQRTEVSVGVTPQSLDETISVKGTASYEVEGRTATVTRELSLEPIKDVIEVNVGDLPSHGIISIVRSVITKPMMGTVTMVALAIAVLASRVGSGPRGKDIEEFVTYIDRYRKRGYTEEQIRRDLRMAGVEKTVVDKAFHEVLMRMGKG